MMPGQSGHLLSAFFASRAARRTTPAEASLPVPVAAAVAVAAVVVVGILAG
jgi:hypothetical protein